DSISPYCSPVADVMKRNGLFHPRGVSMLRSRLLTPGPPPRAVSLVPGLKFPGFGCPPLPSGFSPRTPGTAQPPTPRPAPRPTGPAPRTITREDMSFLSASRIVLDSLAGWQRKAEALEALPMFIGAELWFHPAKLGRHS